MSSSVVEIRCGLLFDLLFMTLNGTVGAGKHSCLAISIHL